MLFFVSLGFNAKISALLTGGKPLFVICATTVVLLILQNLVGIAVAMARGATDVGRAGNQYESTNPPPECHTADRVSIAIFETFFIRKFVLIGN